MIRLYTLTLTALVVFACTNQQQPEKKAERYKVSKEEAKLWIKSNQLFKPLPAFKIDSTDENLAKIKLGKMLYYDKRLSKNGTISCNSCHNLDTYGVDNQPTSLGDDGKSRGGRNSPTSLNAFLHVAQFWDGRAKDVEEQAKGPILNPIEMGMPHADFVVDRIAAIKDYQVLYAKAFPAAGKMTYDNLTSAIGFFERSLITPSRFDKFLENDFEALNDKEKAGLRMFITLGCPTCHMGIGVGGGMYQKFGVHSDYWQLTKSQKIDLGIHDLSKNESDKFKFKVPSLRNVTKTHPYFHDGSVQDLKNSVVIMAKIQLNKDLTDAQADTLVSFLETLTGEVPAYAKNE